MSLSDLAMPDGPLKPLPSTDAWRSSDDAVSRFLQRTASSSARRDRLPRERPRGVGQLARERAYDEETERLLTEIRRNQP